MNDALGHFLSVALFLVLLFDITREDKDDRLRMWLAAWICVLVYYGLGSFGPHESLVILRSAIAESAMALGALFFALSSMILSERRTAGLRLGVTLAIPTLGCIWLAYFHIGWLATVAFVTLRQFVGITAAIRARKNQGYFSLLVPPFAVLTGGMIDALRRLHPRAHDPRLHPTI